MAIDQRSGARSRSRTIGARLVVGLLALLAIAALISLLDTNRGSVRMLDMLREPSVYLAAALAVVGLINGAISLYSSAQPLKEMFFASLDGDEPAPLAPAMPDLALLGALTAPLILLILFGWNGAFDVADVARDMVR